MISKQVRFISERVKEYCKHIRMSSINSNAIAFYKHAEREVAEYDRRYNLSYDMLSYLEDQLTASLIEGGFKTSQFAACFGYHKMRAYNPKF